MSNFHVGDKVRFRREDDYYRRNHFYGTSEGQIFTVREVDPPRYAGDATLVRVDNFNLGAYSSRFEPALKLQMAFEF